MKSQKPIVCNKKVCQSIRSQKINERYRNRYKDLKKSSVTLLSPARKNSKKVIYKQKQIINSHIKLKVTSNSSYKNTRSNKFKNNNRLHNKTDKTIRLVKSVRYKLPDKSKIYKKSLNRYENLHNKSYKPIIKSKSIKSRKIKIKTVNRLDASKREIQIFEKKNPKQLVKYRRNSLNNHISALSKIEKQDKIRVNSLSDQLIDNRKNVFAYYKNKKVLSNMKNSRSLINQTIMHKQNLAGNIVKSDTKGSQSLINQTLIHKERLISSILQNKIYIIKNHDDYYNYISRLRNKNTNFIKNRLNDSNLNIYTKQSYQDNKNDTTTSLEVYSVDKWAVNPGRLEYLKKQGLIVDLNSHQLISNKIELNNFINIDKKVVTEFKQPIYKDFKDYINKEIKVSETKTQFKLYSQIVRDELQKEVFDLSKKDNSFKQRQKIVVSSNYQRFTKSQTDNLKHQVYHEINHDNKNSSTLNKQKSEFSKKVKKPTQLYKLNKKLNAFNRKLIEKDVEKDKDEMLEVGTLGAKLMYNPKMLKLKMIRDSQRTVQAAVVITKTTTVVFAGIKKIITSVIASNAGILILLILIPLLILSSVMSSSASTYSLNFVLCTDEFRESLAEKINDLNNEASDRLDSIVASAESSYDEVSVNPPDVTINIDYRYFLCILAVKNEQEFDDSDIEGIASIHNLFYEIRTRSSTFIVFEERDRVDGDGGSETEIVAVTKTRLDVSVNFKSILEVVDLMGFTDDQIERVNILLTNEIGEDAISGTGTGIRATNLTPEELEELYDIISRISDPKRKEIIESGLTLFGHTRYKWGGKAPAGGMPAGLDCSGFVDWCYKTSLGYEGLRAGGTAYQFGVGSSVSQSDLKPGDLGFWKLPSEVANTSNDANHVGIYMGTLENGEHVYMHSQGGTGVTISSFPFNYYKTITDVNLTFNDFYYYGVIA